MPRLTTDDAKYARIDFVNSFEEKTKNYLPSEKLAKLNKIHELNSWKNDNVIGFASSEFVLANANGTVRVN